MNDEGVLYEDEAIIAINKPAQILVHRSAMTSRREQALLQIVRNYVGGAHVYAVHRLDRATSGVLLFAKSSAFATFLAEQFAQRRPTKIYEGVVRGWPRMDRIDHPLVSLETGLAQEASTELKILRTLTLDKPCDRYPQSRYAWLELKPLTGRRHQLRRHLKHAAHPLIGDTTYGHGPHNRLFRDEFDCARLLLHHRELTFTHPLTQNKMTLRAPHDGDFRKVIALFGDG